MVTSTGLCQTNFWHFVDLIPKQRLKMVIIRTNLSCFSTAQKSLSSSEVVRAAGRMEKHNMFCIGLKEFYFLIFLPPES